MFFGAIILLWHNIFSPWTTKRQVIMWRHRNNYFSSDDESSEDEEFEILKLQDNFPAWNIDGSTSDSPPEGFTWITFAEHITGKKRGKCSFSDCYEKAQVGGHLWIRQIGCCIAPICSKCNYHENEKRMQGGNSKVRKGTTVIKIGLTEEMTSAPRRYSSR